MTNNLYTNSTEFSTGSYRANNSNHKQHTNKLGRVSSTNRVVAGRERLDAIEREFFAISFKSTRSDNQRSERRAKR